MTRLSIVPTKKASSIKEISERYIKSHDEDMAALGVTTPTVTPKATEHMEEMIALISSSRKKRIRLLRGWRCVFFDK